MQAGEVWHHAAYYRAPQGAWVGKYLLILDVSNGDVVYRLLTSRDQGRPRVPACFHGDPYPAFFLGIPGGHLHRDTWVDLRECEDMDVCDFSSLAKSNALTLCMSIQKALLCNSLLCAANAQDTTGRQRKAMMNLRATMGCH